MATTGYISKKSQSKQPQDPNSGVYNVDPYGEGLKPIPRIGGLKVGAVHLDDQTNGIEEIMLEDRTRLSKQQVIDQINCGNSEGLVTNFNQYGEYFKTEPDVSMENNLKNLPKY